MGLTISANKQQQATLVELSDMINTSKALAATLQHSLYSHAVISTMVTLTNLPVQRLPGIYMATSSDNKLVPSRPFSQCFGGPCVLSTLGLGGVRENCSIHQLWVLFN